MASQKSATDRGRIIGMVLMGCDLEIAAHTVGWSEQRLKKECDKNPQFAADLALREGSVELHHMKNVHKAGEDVKHWRASTWWLTRKSAERRERRLGRSIALDDLHVWVEEIIDTIWAEVTSAEDRDRLTLRLLQMLDRMDQEHTIEIAGRKEFEEVYGEASTSKS